MTDNENPNRLSDAERAMVEALRERGFAVCIFNPDELGEADSGDVEDEMCARGWDTINTDPVEDDTDEEVPS